MTSQRAGRPTVGVRTAATDAAANGPAERKGGGRGTPRNAPGTSSQTPGRAARGQTKSLCENCLLLIPPPANPRHGNGMREYGNSREDPWRGPDALFLLPDAAKRLLDEEEWFFSGHGTRTESTVRPLDREDAITALEQARRLSAGPRKQVTR